MTRNLRKSAAIATDLMFAPMVAMMRLPIMAAEAQTGRMPLETIGAGTEKLAAMAEGAMAAQMTYAKAMLSFWPEVLTGRNPTLLSGATTEKAMQDALRPASRRVRSNFRRLSK